MNHKDKKGIIKKKCGCWETTGNFGGGGFYCKEHAPCHQEAKEKSECCGAEMFALTIEPSRKGLLGNIVENGTVEFKCSKCWKPFIHSIEQKEEPKETIEDWEKGIFESLRDITLKWCDDEEKHNEYDMNHIRRSSQFGRLLIRIRDFIHTQKELSYKEGYEQALKDKSSRKDIKQTGN